MYSVPAFTQNTLMPISPSQVSPFNVVRQAPQQSQQFVIINQNNDTINNPSGEKVRIIRDGEREYFKDGTPLLRVYRVLGCCRSRFIRNCPTCNCCLWFYSVPCWLLTILFLLFLGFLIAIITLITQLPQIKTYYTYDYYYQTLEYNVYVATDTGCLNNIACTTSFGSGYYSVGSLVKSSGSNIHSSILFVAISVAVFFIKKLIY